MNDLQDLSDEQLLDAYFRGDAEGFEVFFKRHFRKVVGYNISRGAPPAEAAEIAQEVFTKLHKNIHYYDPSKPALPWFFTIVKNTWRDWLRHRQRHQTTEILVDSIPEPQGLEIETRMREATRDTAQLFLDLLTEDQRAVVEFRVFEDLPFSEIAARTGKSEVATRKIFERALTSIRNRMGDL